MNDAHWIRAMRSGDAASFEELYAATKGPVYRYACSLGTRVDADDLLQEAFLGLVKNVHRIDESRPLLPYLLTSVRNRHLDRLRAPASRRRVDLAVSAEATAGSGGAVSERMERHERRTQVTAALAELPEVQAEVVRLRIYAELSYDAIATQVAAPVATVRNRYRAALERLRTVLGKAVNDA